MSQIYVERSAFRLSISGLRPNASTDSHDLLHKCTILILDEAIHAYGLLHFHCNPFKNKNVDWIVSLSVSVFSKSSWLHNLGRIEKKICS